VIKLFVFLRRQPDLTHEQFCDRWLTEFAPLALGVPEWAGAVRRYVQNHALPSARLGSFPASEFDGVAEVWFESVGDLVGAVRSPPYADAIAPAIWRIADRESAILVAAEESLQFDRGFGGVKFIGLSRRAAGFTHDEWVRYWIDVHGPLAHGIPEFTRYYGKYVHNYVVPVELEGAATTEDYDGIVEEWVESAASFAACLAEPRYLEVVRPDERRFVDLSRSAFVLATEHVLAG
jgi:hypothetical protein